MFQVSKNDWRKVQINRSKMNKPKNLVLSPIDLFSLNKTKMRRNFEFQNRVGHNYFSSAAKSCQGTAPIPKLFMLKFCDTWICVFSERNSDQNSFHFSIKEKSDFFKIINPYLFKFKDIYESLPTACELNCIRIFFFTGNHILLN